MFGSQQPVFRKREPTVILLKCLYEAATENVTFNLLN